MTVSLCTSNSEQTSPESSPELPRKGRKAKINRNKIEKGDSGVIPKAPSCIGQVVGKSLKCVSITAETSKDVATFKCFRMRQLKTEVTENSIEKKEN